MAEPGIRAAPDEPRSPWLRTGFVLAAAFIGFVAVIGAAIAVGSDTSGNDGSTTAQALGTRTADPPRSTPAADGAECPELADERQDVPTSAPAGVTWTLYEAVALPSSKAAGPAVADEDVARCYAHTPGGALLATSQISVRYLAAGDWLKVTRTQTVGEGRDTYIADRTEAERTAPPDEEGGTVHGQIAGFRFVTYNDTTAVIQTVWRFPDGRMQAATTTVLWQDGDWKLEYPADPAAPTPVDSLAGYAEWGGV
ncbi:hypothetical protein F7R91_31545 [Streptomyces luteolifulvus]|uniref:DUF8175 domain-containing protein n=1 Tax=Streptomyces luteolifulvus TaxID=2615112 RepID=A0A6H9UT69_9ACTN|nr:hypothetical protein [Streptomyces luteolifulvus]KAB1141744.1 hypothetical protein F7R91_31545 [Streptomyces luteolifulvus]